MRKNTLRPPPLQTSLPSRFRSPTGVSRPHSSKRSRSWNKNSSSKLRPSTKARPLVCSLPTANRNWPVSSWHLPINSLRNRTQTYRMHPVRIFRKPISSTPRRWTWRFPVSFAMSLFSRKLAPSNRPAIQTRRCGIFRPIWLNLIRDGPDLPVRARRDCQCKFPRPPESMWRWPATIWRNPKSRRATSHPDAWNWKIC